MFFGRFHPLAVHMPIGLVVLLAAFELLALSPKLRSRIDPALTPLTLMAFASAAVAVVLGWVLARDGGYPLRLLDAHRRFAFATLAASLSTVVAWHSVERRGRSRGVYRAAVGATTILLSIGAHFGGSLTHGENYLVELAPWSNAPKTAAAAGGPAAITPGADARVFEDVVLPILNRKCASCHGAEKSKGGLRVDSLEALTKGGKRGPAIVAGHSEQSRLVERVVLPISSDEHMPPADKPQLTAVERELISFWIDSTGRREAPAAAAHASASVVTPANVVTAPSAKPPSPPTLSPAPRAVLRAPSVPIDYRDDIAPLLAAKCSKCHGTQKQRGGLRTDSLEALVNGGQSGPAVVMGAPTRSLLLSRVRLPLEDDDHMPPEGEAQLDRKELAKLASWIARGDAARARSDHQEGLENPKTRPSIPPK